MFYWQSYIPTIYEPIQKGQPPLWSRFTINAERYPLVACSGRVIQCLASDRSLLSCFCPNCWAPFSASIKSESFRMFNFYRSQRPKLPCLFGFTAALVRSSDCFIDKYPVSRFCIIFVIYNFVYLGNFTFLPTERMQICDLAIKIVASAFSACRRRIRLFAFACISSIKRRWGRRIFLIEI